MAKKQEIKGFREFINTLHIYKASYEYVLYGISHLYHYLLGDYTTSDMEGDYISMLPGNIVLQQPKIMLEQTINFLDLSVPMPDKISAVGMAAADTNRKAIVNTFYEGIMNYVKVFKKNDLILMKCLQNQNWFKVLNLIRNNASHFDNRGKTLDKDKRNFPKYITEDVVVWKTITITHGMMGETLRYNDIEIKDLLDEAICFLLENKHLFDAK